MMEEQTTKEFLEKESKKKTLGSSVRPVCRVYNRTWRTSVLMIKFYQTK